MSAPFNQPHVLKSVAVVEVTEIGGGLIEAAFLDFDDRFGRSISLYAERCLIDGSAPALLHCPGGGQTVDRADLTDWAHKGFSVVSFDWQIGRYPNHDPRKKSRWPEEVHGQSGYIRNEAEAILPLAVEASGVCIDWLLQSGRVDVEAIGVTGISWGGYLAWLIAAYEPRVSAAVPVYGCGGHFEARHPGGLDPHPRVKQIWKAQWDPFSIPHLQQKPVCYLSCTNDFFGVVTFADALLNRLRVPHRRGWLANSNHCIGPRESALGLAWLRHYLADGPAVPKEPLLHPDLTLEVDREDEVVGEEIWWTPELRDGHLGCWLRGAPPKHGYAAAYGRIHYSFGYTLSTPLLYVPEALSVAPASVPPEWPDPQDGLGWDWNMGSTQFHSNQVAVETLSPGIVRLQRDSHRTDDAPSFFHNSFAHPGWNTGNQKAIELHLATEPDECPRDAKVTITLRGSSKVSQVKATLPIRDGTLRVDLREFPGFPAIHTWSGIVRMQVELSTKARAFRIGKLTRVDS